MKWSWHSGGQGSLLLPADSILAASLWHWGHWTRHSHKSLKSVKWEIRHVKMQSWSCQMKLCSCHINLIYNGSFGMHTGQHVIRKWYRFGSRVLGWKWSQNETCNPKKSRNIISNLSWYNQKIKRLVQTWLHKILSHQLPDIVVFLTNFDLSYLSFTSFPYIFSTHTNVAFRRAMYED